MTEQQRIQKLKVRLRRGWRFLTEDIWDVELSSLSFIHRAGVKAVRVTQLVFRGFKEDQCPLHASALTFSTLMSIVPVLAVSLALARGFGAGDKAEEWFKGKVSEFTSELSAGSASTNGSRMTGHRSAAQTVPSPWKVPPSVVQSASSDSVQPASLKQQAPGCGQGLGEHTVSSP